jgi:carbamoyltransferase
MNILGLGGFPHDESACLLRQGELVAACEERKLNRSTRPGELPEAAIRECLAMGKLAANSIDIVAVARPFPTGPSGDFHLQLRALFPKSQLMILEHHVAHAASAFYASGFDHATVVTLDRSGDFRCGAKWNGNQGELRLEREWHYPDSIGELYSRATEFLGFESGHDEHKVQWMSTLGDDSLVPLFREVLSHGSLQLNPAYFDANRMRHGGWSAKFYDAIGLKDLVTPFERVRPNIARGLQKAVEEAVLHLAGEGENLCLAGGLFYNALLVAALEHSGKWKRVFVQPAAGNSGTALGAALAAWKKPVSPGNLCLGPEYSAEETKKVLENCKLRFKYLLTTDELVDQAVSLIGDNQIVAWMQGRMEFGPRALGNRSILASPLNAYSTENLNVFIKHREPFRKFAASVPAEKAGDYFEVGPNARFLATVGRVKPEHRQTFEAAILGQDYVRVHTVTAEDNPLYHRLLHAAGKSTGLPVLYNTSFNLFGDPLVCSPRDAVRSFYSSGIDALFCGQFVVQK